jgi:hypothetical protein
MRAATAGVQNEGDIFTEFESIAAPKRIDQISRVALQAG